MNKTISFTQNGKKVRPKKITFFVTLSIRHKNINTLKGKTKYAKLFNDALVSAEI